MFCYKFCARTRYDEVVYHPRPNGWLLRRRGIPPPPPLSCLPSDASSASLTGREGEPGMCSPATPSHLIFRSPEEALSGIQGAVYDFSIEGATLYRLQHGPVLDAFDAVFPGLLHVNGGCTLPHRPSRPTGIDGMRSKGRYPSHLSGPAPKALWDISLTYAQIPFPGSRERGAGAGSAR
jgi:hypothetical protein